MNITNDIILQMKHGSHLYGTNTPLSDLDIKGIFLPTIEQIFLNNIPKHITENSKKNNLQKNTSNDIDFQLYSLHYFIQKACEGETIAIDMLHVNYENIIKKNYIWDEIVKNKHKFYSKNLCSFIAYAKRQADKYGVKSSSLSDVEILIDFFNKIE